MSTSSILAWLFRILILAGIALLLHKVESIEQSLHAQRPVNNITTEFVVIKADSEDFDMKERR